MTYLMNRMLEDVFENWRLHTCQFDCVSLDIWKSWYLHYHQYSNIYIVFLLSIDRYKDCLLAFRVKSQFYIHVLRLFFILI